MSGRHAANSWDSYLSAHHGRLDDFRDHFVERDTLEIETAETTVLWSGVLYCRDGIEIQVDKRQRTWLRSGRRWVETIGYSYHVMIRAGDGVSGLFRYDNAHPHPGHADAHHRHEFAGDGDDDTVRWVGEAGWPTLGDVIEESCWQSARTWRDTTCDTESGGSHRFVRFGRSAMTDGDGIRGYRLEVYRDQDGSWVAEVPDLPGCVAASTDPQGLLALAEDSIEAWVEAAVDDGRTVPAPAADDEYSGRFVLRVPKGIHRRLAAQARRERVSLNTLCATALSASVGAAEVSNR